MADAPKPETEAPELATPVVEPANVEGGPAAHPENPATQPAPALAGILGKLFKRNGRHPADCQCPIHRKGEVDSRFLPPAVPAADAPPQPPVAFAPPPVPIDPARFAVWGRLVVRAVKAAYRFATSETPGLVRRCVAAEAMEEAEGDAILAELQITPEEFADLESSATRIAQKYNLTTGYDEEIEFGITLGGIGLRVMKVNKTLRQVLERVEGGKANG